MIISLPTEIRKGDIPSMKSSQLYHTTTFDANMLITSGAYLLIRTHELRCFPSVLVYSYDKHQFAQPNAFHSEPVNSNKRKQTNPVIKKLTHNEVA